MEETWASPFAVFARQTAVPLAGAAAEVLALGTKEQLSEAIGELVSATPGKVSAMSLKTCPFHSTFLLIFRCLLCLHL